MTRESIVRFIGVIVFLATVAVTLAPVAHEFACSVRRYRSNFPATPPSAISGHQAAKAESCPLERHAGGAILLHAAASGFRRAYEEPDAS